MLTPESFEASHILRYVLVPMRNLLRLTVLLPFEILFRTNFGKRALPLYSLPFTIFPLFFAFSGGRPPEIFRPIFGNVGPMIAGLIVAGIYLTLFAKEWKKIRQRDREGILWHTRSQGTLRWSFLGKDKLLTNAVVIPLYSLAYGAIFYPLSDAALLYGTLGAFLYAILYLFDYYDWNSKIYDAQDAMIERRNFSAALENNRPEQQNGLAVPIVMSPAFREKHGRAVGAALAALNPRLRGLQEAQPMERDNQPSESRTTTENV